MEFEISGEFDFLFKSKKAMRLSHIPFGSRREVNMCEGSKEEQLFAGLPVNFAGKENVSCMLLSSFGKYSTSRLI